MLSTPTTTTKETKQLSQTALSIQALQFAHRWLFKKHPELTEEQWSTMMFEYGIRYATAFSICFGDERQAIVLNALIEAQPAEGEKHNWFWQWFKLKWMQDDWDYIDQKVYTQAISYQHYKTYLIQNEVLEVDLINLLHDKQNGK